MKKSYLLSLVLFFSLISISAQTTSKVKGNKILEANTINVDPFRLIEVGENFDVVLFEQGTPKVRINADSNLHEYIIVDVSAEKLTIKTSKPISKFKKLSIEIGYNGDLSQIIAKGKVTMRGNTVLNTERTELIVSDYAEVDLNFKSTRVEIKGSGKTKINSVIEAESIALTGNSSTKMSINANAESLNVNLGENSDLNVIGIAAKSSLFLQDDSYFSGGELDLAIATLSIKGKSKAYIKATDKLSLTASENSETYLISNPLIEIKSFNDFPKLEKIKKAPTNSLGKLF